MGDLNARVGRDHTVWQGVLGRHGVGNCNANERMLLELCSEQGLIITNSLFQQIAKFKTIWQHPRSWNTGTSWTTSSCARRTSVTCYIPESWPVLTATQTTGLQRGKEGYRCSKPTGCWRGKFSSRKSSSPDKKRRNCQYGKQIPSTMLREVKEELSEGIYIGFRTDGSVLNLRRLLARKRDDRGADPWTAHTKDTLQTMVDHFARAAQAFGLTISLKKTEVSLHQNSPLAVYSPPQITINGHLLTYLSSVISNDAMITKDLDHLLAKASSSFGHLQHRMWESHPFRLMTKVRVTWQLSSALFCMLWKPGCCAESIYSCWNASTRGNCVYHGNTLAGLRRKRRGSREGLTAKYRGYAATSCWASHVSGMNDTRMPKAEFFSELGKG